MNRIQTSQDKKRALDILEKAFINSDGMTWMLKKKNGKNLRMFLSYIFHEASLRGGAWLTSDKNGIVLFYNMRNKKQSLSNFIRGLYVFLVILGVKNGLKAYRYKKLIDSIRPKTGWFGWLFATDHRVDGVSAAYEIKRELFRISDETKEPIYVETTVSRAMILYKASGYHEYARIAHPYENLTVYFMKRHPNTYQNENLNGPKRKHSAEVGLKL